MRGVTAGGFWPENRSAREAESAVDQAALEWRSARCGTHGSCVEIATMPDGGVAVRDGKAAGTSPVLTFTPDEWAAFTAAIRSGELA